MKLEEEILFQIQFLQTSFLNHTQRCIYWTEMKQFYKQARNDIITRYNLSQEDFRKYYKISRGR